MQPFALIVHGGAWDIPTELEDSCRRGVRRALERGWAILEAGGTALDACEEAILDLEDDPVFDAGLGSHLNRDGKAQLDAIIMNGASLKAGAVAAVERIRNPISLARLVLEKSDHMMIVGAGAEQFGVENGLDLCDPDVFRIPQEVHKWTERSGTPLPMGTVGAVALDRNGHIASGTSTGGTLFKYPGRVGDSPLIGCGCYADSDAAGVSSTGHGESIMRIVLAKTACELVRAGQLPQAAAEESIDLLTRRTPGRGGLIMLDRRANVGAAFSTRNMVHAFMTSTDPTLHVGL